MSPMLPYDPALDPTPAADLLEAHAPDTLRHRALRAALDWKAAWLKLGAVLSEAQHERVWVTWGFRSMKLWVEGELGVSAVMGRRMLEGFEWLQDEVPEIARSAVSLDAPPVRRHVPEPATVALLAEARRQVDEDVVPEAVYDDWRARALRGESGTAELRRELKAHTEVPPDETEHADLPRLRKALRAAEKLLEQIQDLGEPPAELVRMISDLRDHLFQTLAARERTASDEAEARFEAESWGADPGASVVLPPPSVSGGGESDADDVEPLDSF
jgi:hypothetical protein